LVGYVGAVV
jgi:hypothetical protein